MKPVEYRLDGRDVTLYLEGIRIRAVNRRPITRAVAEKIIAALTEAVELGTAHGVCDRNREIENALTGTATPGHVSYGYHRPDPSKPGWLDYNVIAKTVDGVTTVVFDGTGVRPGYLIGDILAELDNAFRLAGRYSKA